MRLLLSALLSVTLAGFAALPSASGDAFLEQDPIVCEAADEEELPCAFGDDKICPGVQCPGGTGSDGGKSEEGSVRHGSDTDFPAVYQRRGSRTAAL